MICSAAACVTQIFRDTSTPLKNSFFGIEGQIASFQVLCTERLRVMVR